MIRNVSRRDRPVPIMWEIGFASKLVGLIVHEVAPMADSAAINAQACASHGKLWGSLRLGFAHEAETDWEGTQDHVSFAKAFTN